MLNFRRFISAVFGVALLLGGIPYLTCTPAVCAANTACASKCCGTNCAWPTSSHESSKRDTGCNQQCPLITASKPMTISQTQPIVAAVSDVGEAQPFSIAFSAPCTLAILQNSNLHSPTL